MTGVWHWPQKLLRLAATKLLDSLDALPQTNEGQIFVWDRGERQVHQDRVKQKHEDKGL